MVRLLLNCLVITITRLKWQVSNFATVALKHKGQNSVSIANWEALRRDSEVQSLGQRFQDPEYRFLVPKPEVANLCAIAHWYAMS